MDSMNSAGAKTPAVISVAAGEQQLLVIRKAVEMGFAVIAIDRNPDAPGFALADACICLSTYDPAPLITRLSELSAEFDFRAVFTRSSGPPVVTTAAIAEAFLLPGAHVDAARRIVHKADFVMQSAALGIATPKQQVATSLAEIHWYEVPGPAVVKPSLALVGQTAVTVVTDRHEFFAAFSRAAAASHDSRVVVESFIPGRDVVLLAFVINGVLRPVVLLDEHNQVMPGGGIERLAFSVPSVFTGSPVEKRIHRLAQNIATGFGVGTSPFLLSCRCQEDDDPVAIELHLDFGGDRILDELLPAATSFDFVEFGLLSLTGSDPVLGDIRFRSARLEYERKVEMIEE